MAIGSGGITEIWVPSGGLAGQVLTKASNADYDMAWAAGGGGGGSGTVTSVAAGDGLVTSPSPITVAGTVSIQNRFADSLLLMGV